MDDRNNRDGFDEFFKGPQEGAGATDDQDRGKREQPQEQAPSRASYYYSYGPFKSSTAGGEQPQGQVSPAEPARPAESAGPVEITPPRPVTPYQPAPVQARGGWEFNKKPPRRSGFRGMFAAFMAGVVAVGGLMFAADYNDWFSPAKALMQPVTGSPAAETNAAGEEANPVSNALDLVRPNNIAKIFEQASPAVVKIETYVEQRSGSRGGSLFEEDPFFRQFFGDDYFDSPRQQPNSGTGEMMPSGLGSGFFFEEDGYILTNQHVIGNADKVTVRVLGEDKPLEAKVLGQSYELDLAVIKVEGDNFPTLKLGDSGKIAVGEWVVAIGNPNGFDHTVTVGVLSAKERPITIPDPQGDRKYEHLLQTDASINPGNSGGPLINLDGEVIGMNTAVSSQSQGIGFAIPTSTISKVVDSLKNNQEIPKEPAPFIGATLTTIDDNIASRLGLDSTDGAAVYEVLYKSPAYHADLRQYDVITGINGTKYKTKEEIIAAIQKFKVGDTITLNVIRDGKKLELKVEIGDKNKFQTQQ